MQELVIRLLESTAAERYASDQKSDMSFADACRFWGLQVKGPYPDVQIARVEQALDWLDEVTLESSVRLNHWRLDLEDAIRLRGVQEYLLKRFSRHLNLLRNRQ